MPIHITSKASGGFKLSFPYDSSTVARVKKCLDMRWDKSSASWHSVGQDVLLDLRRFNIEVCPADSRTQEVIDEYWASVEAITELHKSKADYQTIGTQLMLAQRRGILGDTMGLGKSKQALDALASVDARRTLLLAPKSLLWNWETEIGKWYPDWRVYVVGDKPAERNAAYDLIERDELDRERPVVVVCNYEKTLSPDFPQRDWDASVFDEAHALRNQRAKRTKHAATISRRSKRSWALTGTPLVSSVADLHGLFDVVRPGLLGTWWHFSEQHVELDQWGSPRASKNTELLQDRIAPWIVRRTYKDVMDQLPEEPLRTTIEVELSKPERAAYERAKRLVLDKVSGEMVSHQALAPLQRFLAAPELAGYNVASSKLQALVDTIEGWDGRAVVFCHHIDVAHHLVAKLKAHENALIIGAVPAEQRADRVAAFNAGKLGKVMICNDAGAYGLNITGAGLAVHYELDWLPSVEEQREGRIWRRGQPLRPHIVSIVAFGTLDGYIRQRNDVLRKRTYDLVERPAEIISAAELRKALA